MFDDDELCDEDMFLTVDALWYWEIWSAFKIAFWNLLSRDTTHDI